MKTRQIAFLAGMVLTAHAHASSFGLLYDFGQPLGNIGIYPSGGLVVDSSGVFYGVDYSGGLNNFGCIYNLGTNSAFSIWDFANGTDGAYPIGDLVLSGGTLFGVTHGTGFGDYGTVYKINTDGSDFSTLYTFTNGTDGSTPMSGLVLDGDVLYGTASGGGVGWGTVYQINTNGNANGNGFSVIHTFTAPDPTTATNQDGFVPAAALCLVGETLYGTTTDGGSNRFGTIFAIQTGNNSFQTLHDFVAADGYDVQAGLLATAGKLFGVASEGGGSGQGSIFSLNPDGTDFTNIYSFDNGGLDGVAPEGRLAVIGDTLYGTASSGGQNGNGAIFSIGVDGSNFQPLYSFSALDPNYYDNYDGASPQSSLLLYEGQLYGAAAGGGPVPYEGYGTVFLFNPNGNQLALIDAFDNQSSLTTGDTPEGTLAASGGVLYGDTYFGGLYGGGVVFRVNEDGSRYTILHSFSGADGVSPVAGLALAGNVLYGTAPIGGIFQTNGVVFSINTDGSNFTLLHQFTGGTNGWAPSAAPIVSGNMLYGTTYYGGSNGFGTVFSVNLTNLAFATLHSFDSSDGASLQAPLILSGNTLYGEAYGGGIGAGTLFSLRTDGSSFTNLRTFSYISGLGASGEGQNPGGGLILIGGALYGTTYSGGEHQTGCVFAIDTNGGGYTCLANFDPTAFNGLQQTNDTGTLPEAGLLAVGDSLYGATSRGGFYGWGTVFSVKTNANGMAAPTILHAFAGPISDGGYAYGGMALDGGELFGSTGGGGIYTDGVIYGLVLVPPLMISGPSQSPVVYWTFDGDAHTLQESSNLSGGRWSNAPALNWTNGQFIGLQLTNVPSSGGAYFRLKE